MTAYLLDTNHLGEVYKSNEALFTTNAAEDFGRIKADLRRKGRPIPAVDIQIAAIARVNDLIVLTADAHFGYIADLRTENWLA